MPSRRETSAGGCSTAGFSAPTSEIPQPALVLPPRDPEILSKSSHTSRCAGGVPFAFGSGELQMIRLGVLSIVVSLAAGQNAGLLCKVWCDRHEAHSAGCHH